MNLSDADPIHKLPVGRDPVSARALKRKRNLNRPNAATGRVANHNSHSSRIDRHIDTHAVKETLFAGLIQHQRRHGSFKVLLAAAESATVGGIRGHGYIEYAMIPSICCGCEHQLTSRDGEAEAVSLHFIRHGLACAVILLFRFWRLRICLRRNRRGRLYRTFRIYLHFEKNGLRIWRAINKCGFQRIPPR